MGGSDSKPSAAAESTPSSNPTSSELDEKDLKQLYVLFQFKLNKNDREDVHHCICDYCKRKNFDGYRYKCLICANYDLCGICYEQKKINETHQLKHSVVRLEKPNEVCGMKVDTSELNLNKLVDKYNNNIHQNIHCDVCKKTPIQGLRFKSDQCNNYNLCLNCLKNEKTSLNHKIDHQMIVYISNETLKIGSNDIELLDKLGEGGFGQVFKAKLKNTNNLVACKIIKINKDYDPYLTPRGINPETFHKSYIQELQAYKELKGENILKMIGHSSEEQGNLVKLMIITEFMSKGSLASLLEKEPNILYSRRLNIACDILAGITRIHERGYIHRYIRPDNILIADDYTAKIGDMGISRFLPTNSDRNIMTLVGCPAYMPLEFFSGRYNHKLDIYTFGLTLNELFGGKTYPVKKNAMIMLEFISKCTDNDPKKRPESKELQEMLCSIQNKFDQYFKTNSSEYLSLKFEQKNEKFTLVYEDYIANEKK